MTEEKEISYSKDQKPTENAGNLDNETEMESAIIRQVEYYFDDANLPCDKFLREQILLDDGWVPLEVLTGFNRFNKLTTNTEVNAKDLLKSTTGLLEVGSRVECDKSRAVGPTPSLNLSSRLEWRHLNIEPTSAVRKLMQQAKNRREIVTRVAYLRDFTYPIANCVGTYCY